MSLLPLKCTNYGAEEMHLDASFGGSPPTDYFALHGSSRFQRPAFIEPAPNVDPAMSSAPAPARWTDRARERLGWIASLQPNWDGYGAARVSRETIERAFLFLQAVMPATAPAPDIGPTKDGYLAFEWHRLSADLEIRMKSPSEYEVSFDDIDHPEKSWESVVGANLRSVVQAIGDIVLRP
jgi:hypothetical protein